MQDAPARPFLVHTASGVHVAGSSHTDILCRRSTHIEFAWKVLGRGGRSDRWTLEEAVAVEARVVARAAGLLQLPQWRFHNRDNDRAGTRAAAPPAFL